MSKTSGLSDTEFRRLLEGTFRPVFAEIAAETVLREESRRLPFAEIDRLRRLGFGALRLPRAEGGAGLSLPQLFEVLAELAAADANLPQALRNHFAFVEQARR